MEIPCSNRGPTRSTWRPSPPPNTRGLHWHPVRSTDPPRITRWWRDRHMHNVGLCVTDLSSVHPTPPAPTGKGAELHGREAGRREKAPEPAAPKAGMSPPPVSRPGTLKGTGQQSGRKGAAKKNNVWGCPEISDYQNSSQLFAPNRLFHWGVCWTPPYLQYCNTGSAGATP